MEWILLALILVGPIPQSEPKLVATVITDRWQPASLVVCQEWERTWRLRRLGVEIELGFKMQFKDAAEASRQPFYPCVFIGSDGPYRISCGGSGDAIISLHALLSEWRKGVIYDGDDESIEDSLLTWWDRLNDEHRRLAWRSMEWGQKDTIRSARLVPAEWENDKPFEWDE